MKRSQLAWGFVVLLAILHWDFWWWDDRTLLFGFMPIGLGYQALISVLASLAWFMVVRFAWPDAVEKWAEEAGPDAESR